MSEVIIGRLKRKIEKLKNQRDHYQAENKFMAKMISMYPYIKSDWKKYEDYKAASARLKELEARNKEQEFLIKVLLKDTDLKDYEIKRAYDEVIKRETQELNRRMK